VDPDLHKAVEPSPQYSADLSYLGTYAPDRQQALEQLFLEPARCTPRKRFVIGGALYPEDFPWSKNIWFVRHVPPPLHPSFYCSSNLTLSITRSAMAEMGYCPSGRLFEAAACETPVVSDHWEGLEEFFEPGREILIASQAGDVVDDLALPPDELRRIGSAARERVSALLSRLRKLTSLVISAGRSEIPQSATQCSKIPMAFATPSSARFHLLRQRTRCWSAFQTRSGSRWKASSCCQTACFPSCCFPLRNRNCLTR